MSELVLTEKSNIHCNHGARVNVVAAQRYVKIANECVLSRPDPAAKGISGCPNIGAGIKPCTFSGMVTNGYSSFITMNGRSIIKDSLTGLTDGTPPGVTKYSVFAVKQTFVTTSE